MLIKGPVHKQRKSLWWCFHRWCGSQVVPGVRFPHRVDTYLRLCVVLILPINVCSFSLIVLFGGSCSFNTKCLRNPSSEKAKQPLDVLLLTAYIGVVNLSGDSITGSSLSSLPFTVQFSSQGGMYAALLLQTFQVGLCFSFLLLWGFKRAWITCHPYSQLTHPNPPPSIKFSSRMFSRRDGRKMLTPKARLTHTHTHKKKKNLPCL